MGVSQLRITRLPLRFFLLAAILALVACSESVPPTPQGTPRPGPSWTAQQAIEKIKGLPLSTGEPSWNGEFDRYTGRWQLTLVYQVRRLYPPRDERRTVRWYVYEDTGEVEGPFK